MTKRCGSFEIVNNKKPKLDDLWDDDLDSETIEDCFKLATQVCEQDNVTCTQHNNVTILSTYNAFKNPKHIFTSTPCFGNEASTSKQHNLQHRIKQLEEKYEEKEGEVTILRANLKEFKHTQFVDNERKLQEWREQLNCKIKEMDEIRSELEFKNLEIANLKQRIKEITRKLAKQSLESPRQQQIIPKSEFRHDNIAISNNCRLSIISKPEYPLKDLDLVAIFQHLEGCKQNSQINCLYSEMIYLTSLKADEFERNETFHSIDRVITIFRNILKEFNEMLGNYKYDINNCKEYGLVTGKILYFLSEMLLFSDYLYDYLYQYDMNELLGILTTIQKNKIGNICVGFQSAFCKFLENSIIKSNSNLIFFNKALKQLILTIEVENTENVMNLCKLLEISSNSSEFVQNLCRNSAEKTDCCILTIFGNLLNNFLNKSTKLDDLSNISNCFLNFVYNLFKTNPKWLYLPENSCSSCINLLCKLSVCLIYKNFEKHKVGKIIEIDLKHAIKVLNLLSFNCYDVFEKCLHTFSQYKEIMHNLTNLQYDPQLSDWINDLEQLNIIEEFPNIPPSKFQDVEL